MKRLGKATLAVILVVICLFTLCGCGQGPVGKIRSAIRGNGKTDSSEDYADQHYVVLTDDDFEVQIYYFDDSDGVTLHLSNFSSNGFLSFFLDLDNDGDHSWSLYDHVYGSEDMRMGGELYASLATSTSISSAMVEDYSRRKGISSYLAPTMTELATTCCEVLLMELQNFLADYTSVTMKDLGFIGNLRLN